MTRKFTKILLALACMSSYGSSYAEFKDIKVDLTGAGVLTADELQQGTEVSFGVVVGSDGSNTRVEATDASANIVINGIYWNDHGLGGGAVITLPVDGPVKIGLGSCQYGNGTATATNAAGDVVVTLDSNTGACWKSNNEVYGYGIYKGGADVLTIKVGNYLPAITVEAVDPSELVEDATVKYSLDGLTNAGLAPAGGTLEIGSTFTIPANNCVYQEGKTLVGWNDGSKNYEIGEVVTVAGDMTLTPVFVNNTVSLADRTEPLTLKWIFGEKNGAPTIGIEGSSKPSAILVTQATIGTEVIDVKLDIDAVAGKFNNGRGDEWAQVNGGTKFSVPSCKGAVISYSSYDNGVNCTVDGQAVTGTSPSFTCIAATDPVEVEVVAGGYMSNLQVMLPLVETAGGVTYEKSPASVVWAFNSTDNVEAYVAEPASGFSVVSFDAGAATCTGSATRTSTDDPAIDENGNDVVFLKYKPATGASDVLTWGVKPAKGLTFTPTRVSGWIQRFGTDAENGVTVTVKNAEGKSVVLGTFTALRANKGHADEGGKAYDVNAVNKFDIELTAAQQAELATMEDFYLTASIGVGNSKEGGFSDIRIYGTLDGTSEEVEKFVLTANPNIENAGTITVYPKASEYDAGTDVKLTAAKNFGYAFVNWTDASGKEVSAEPEFVYTVNADAALTANFKAVNTYELAYAVEGGANNYQVQPSPAPEMVDGRMMYEEGTTVTLTASSNPIVKFTNWADGQSSSEITVTMDADNTDIVANFDAVDYIVGWDFYEAGNDGRSADFFAADNDAVALVMRTAEGTTSGWLDKSQVAAGGYEGRPAAVNWRTTGIGDYYWQTCVNASAFTDIKVITAMTYNYNAYTKQNVEWSLDGETWKSLGSITIPGSKNWTDATFSLPAEANNQSQVYIRWISDKSSSISGTTSSNDGIALGATYITGTAKLIDDGTAPVLTAQVPEEGSNTASINGKIVLTFDEKVKVKDGAMATLGDLTLTPSVTGKTVMFEYKNLVYSTDYTFSLPAGSVMDLTDNAIDRAITINFTTKTRPEVTKAVYDAEVSTVDELLAALDAAAKRTDNTKRFRIFLHDGTYKLPASTTATKEGSDGNTYPDPTTTLATPNVSFVGESRDGVIITNTVPASPASGANVLEGIGKGDVLRLDKAASGTYFQHLTIKSAMGDARGRDIEVNDNSDKTIMKDVCLWGYQDTYVSNNENGRFYFEGGLLRGRTDFLCGKGDVYYNAVTLQMCEKGGYLAVPSKPKQYGYIFKDCEIIGETSGIDGNYTLGRPWGSGTPIALYIDTKMTVKPSAAGWNEMSGGWPARFAEYNSTTASGTVIDLKDRKKTFADVYTNNPVLTKEEADFHSYARVMGGDDDWDPASQAEQAPAPTNVKIDGTILTWDDSKYALLWAVCKDGKVIGFTTEPTFVVEAEVARDAAPVYSVRAANEMGGLGEAVVASATSAISDITADSEVVSTIYYNLQGMRVEANTPGVLVKVDTLASGKTVTTKVVVK